MRKVKITNDVDGIKKEKDMKKNALFYLTRVLLIAAIVFLKADFSWAQEKTGQDKKLQDALKYKIYNLELQKKRKEAAANFQSKYKAGAQAGILAAQMVMPMPDPGGVPHYFGPYANWANSPLPRGPIASLTLTAGGTNYTAPTVTIDDHYGIGMGAAASVTVTAGVITAISLDAPGDNYVAPMVMISDTTGTGATVSVAITPNAGTGIRKFLNSVPLLTPAGINDLGQYIPVAVADALTYPAGGAGYISIPTVTISDPTGTGAAADAVITGDKVTAVTVTNGGANYSQNPLVQFTGGGASSQAVARAVVQGGVITAINLLGSDYYEIAVVEFDEKMHTDLPPTRHRGYVQLATAVVPGSVALTNPDGSAIMMPDGITQAIAVDNPHFLGPTIIANRDKPVRIKFYNLLPTGTGGDLFIPVDTTVMGAGMGPYGMMPPVGDMNYTQNRADIHLHGNNSVWISDGTPHQWITPAGEVTSYPKGVSVVNVPDMPDPGNGAATIYYTNAHSARLMFYHDHSYGITRLNVYAGEAAGYLITDEVEQDLINGTNNSGVNPGMARVLPDVGIPLVIQDRTFVDEVTIGAQDPTWKWGTGAIDPNTGFRAFKTGDLWYPHVYVPAQNPYDPTGANPFGRWHYAAWFWPPATNLIHGPVPNPYYQPDPNLPNYAPWEPPEMPATPNPSMPGEAFMDTPIVNGTLYPFLVVEPKVYRFRILNAADDRFFNLQLYQAYDPVTMTVGTGTEVKMVPAITTAGFPADWPSDGRVGGVPDPATMGPAFIQIGTEGGFLPAPVEILNQPVTWNLNPTSFNFGNVDKHALLIGTAERADVLVDFTAYAGQTLILYNDAPAAFPALDARYDYYTGNPDQLDTGGTPSTLAGYGPNTRTVMQIRVGTTVTTPGVTADLATLTPIFAKTAGKSGVFEASQDQIIMPQAEYNSAYNAAFSADPVQAYVLQHEFVKTFTPIGALLPVTLPLEPKAIQDEMGEAYDIDYGRMSGMLGLELPVSMAGVQNFMLYGYASPPVEIVKGSVYGTPIGSTGDGTQIWKITHNGVDTHTIHTHLYNVQMINRVAWDGAMLPPDLNELGWKETFRVNPLEHMVIALRPTIPNIPFSVPNSVRLIDPTMPEGVTLMGSAIGGFKDPNGQPVTVTNHPVNFGWEYVYHCHILAHEEMDMMHAVGFTVPPKDPSGLLATLTGNGRNRRVVLTWTDNSPLSTTGFTVQRAWDTGFTTGLANFTMGKVTTYTDPIGNTNQTYYYRVIANNTVGDTVTPGFPTLTADSGPSNIAGVNLPPDAPANLAGSTFLQGTNPRVTLTWSDLSTNEQGFTVQRATDANFTLGLVSANVGANTTTFTTGNLAHVTTYYFRVRAFNASGTSAWSTTFSITTP